MKNISLVCSPLSPSQRNMSSLYSLTEPSASTSPIPMICPSHAITSSMTSSHATSSWEHRQVPMPNPPIHQNTFKQMLMAEMAKSASDGTSDIVPLTPVSSDMVAPSAASNTKQKHAEAL